MWGIYLGIEKLGRYGQGICLVSKGWDILMGPEVVQMARVM